MRDDELPEFPSPEQPLPQWRGEGLIALMNEIEVWRALPQGMAEVQRRLSDPNRLRIWEPFKL